MNNARDTGMSNAKLIVVEERERERFTGEGYVAYVASVGNCFW